MTIYHMSCTNQMGPPTNPWAVVDPQLRVYGVSGLRVIDASISKYKQVNYYETASIHFVKSILVPTIPSGNIHAPVVSSNVEFTQFWNRFCICFFR